MSSDYVNIVSIMTRLPDLGLHCRPYHIDRLHLGCGSEWLELIVAMEKGASGLEESFHVLLTSVEGVILMFGRMVVGF